MVRRVSCLCHPAPRPCAGSPRSQGYGYSPESARRLQSCSATGIVDLPTSSQNQNLGPYSTNLVSPFAQGGTCYYTTFSTKDYVGYFQVGSPWAWHASGGDGAHRPLRQRCGPPEDGHSGV
jgi:hypothetical protein